MAVLPAPNQPLAIINADGELVAVFSVTAPTLRSLRDWMHDSDAAGGLEHLHATLSTALEPAIQQALPLHLRPPSDAQVAYALGIARALGVVVPPDTLTLRGAMHDFLDRHIPAYEALRKQRKAARDKTRAPHDEREHSGAFE